MLSGHGSAHRPGCGPNRSVGRLLRISDQSGIPEQLQRLGNVQGSLTGLDTEVLAESRGKVAYWSAVQQEPDNCGSTLKAVDLTGPTVDSDDITVNLNPNNFCVPYRQSIHRTRPRLPSPRDPMTPSESQVRYRARSDVAIRRVGAELYLCVVGWDTDVYRLTGVLLAVWDGLQTPLSIPQLADQVRARSPREQSWVADAVSQLRELTLVEAV